MEEEGKENQGPRKAAADHQESTIAQGYLLKFVLLFRH